MFILVLPVPDGIRKDEQFSSTRRGDVHGGLITGSVRDRREWNRAATQAGMIPSAVSVGLADEPMLPERKVIGDGARFNRHRGPPHRVPTDFLGETERKMDQDDEAWQLFEHGCGR